MALDEKNLHLELFQLSFDHPKVQALLLPVRFEDPKTAWQRLQKFSQDESIQTQVAELMPQLLRHFSQIASPDRTLTSFERLAKNVSSPAEWLQALKKSPRVLETLITLFSGSQFLSEILLRHTSYVDRLVDLNQLSEFKTIEDFEREVQSVWQSGEDMAGSLNAIRRWQRWELLRIGICDLLGLFDLSSITQQLSNLADSLVSQCVQRIAEDLGMSADKFAVIAMGKLGGGELNYSSDIDLVFVAETNAMQFEPLGRRLIDALSRMTEQGFLYRVDMRLRPWGQTGPLVTSSDAYLNYLQQHARLWEKQALLKARVIAGDKTFAEELLEQIRPIILKPADVDLRSEVATMKQRTETHLKQRGQTWGEVKLGEGSIRDVEFVAQYLLLVHGHAKPELLTGHTTTALKALRENDLISQEDQRTLSEGYTFLRTIEHYLQIMHHQQTHSLPQDPAKLAQLAGRLGFESDDAAEQFLQRYQQHCEAIRQIYLSYLGQEEEQPSLEQALEQDVDRLVNRMPITYQETFSPEIIEQHLHLLQNLDEQFPVNVNAIKVEDGCWEVTIVGYDYPGELSLICGLFVVYGLDIVNSHVFTYETSRNKTLNRFQLSKRFKPSSKIVDVFTVRPLKEMKAETWEVYNQRLNQLLRLLYLGKRDQAHGRLVKRVAASLSQDEQAPLMLAPVEIDIDNDLSKRYTVLYIDSVDTFGFLYELTNALALHDIYIGRLEAKVVGERVRDTLFVSDKRGQKILSKEKQQELRAAVVLVKHFTHLLPHAPNPESALIHFREFLEKLLSRDTWMDELASLEKPEVLDALARLLGISDFLWDDFLRMQYGNLFPIISDLDNLVWGKPKAQLQQELDDLLQASPTFKERVAQLNNFKDREMFRVDMRHILGHVATFEQFALELTDLAEMVVTTAYQQCYDLMTEKYGTPMLEQSNQPSSLCITALGKCGGRELGFASDVELMFVYAGNGTTTGPKQITTTEFYEKVVELLMRIIHTKSEGIFDIDLQLRPYGKAGSMAVPFESFASYFGAEGAAWAYERQALIRLRSIGGDVSLGKKLTQLRDRLVYNEKPFDFIAMRAMRERQVRHLVTAGTFNAKFSPGGLVDIEYLVQGLQITHGYEHPSVRAPNTQNALSGLAGIGILTKVDNEKLSEAHHFLREIINSLRMVRGNAKDLTVPNKDSEEFSFLAKRLEDSLDAETLQEKLDFHTETVQQINKKLTES